MRTEINPAVVCAVLTATYGIVVALFIGLDSSTKDELKCLWCGAFGNDTDPDDACNMCHARPYQFTHNEQTTPSKLPIKCLERNNIQHLIDKISEKSTETLKRSENTGTKIFSEYLSSFWSSLTQINWFCTNAISGGNNKWHHLVYWSDYPSDYTVKTSPDISKHNGNVLVKKGGKYFVYYKITIACTKPDLKNKTFESAVDMKPYDGVFHHSKIMHRLHTATCYNYGDLVTSYVDDVIDIEPNTILILKLKFNCSDVEITREEMAFKNNIGLYRV